MNFLLPDRILLLGSGSRKSISLRSHKRCKRVSSSSDPLLVNNGSGHLYILSFRRWEKVHGDWPDKCLFETPAHLVDGKRSHSVLVQLETDQLQDSVTLDSTVCQHSLIMQDSVQDSQILQSGNPYFPYLCEPSGRQSLK